MKLLLQMMAREATKNVIHKYKFDFPVTLHHIWHPDEGFQLAKNP